MTHQVDSFVDKLDDFFEAELAAAIERSLATSVASVGVCTIACYESHGRIWAQEVQNVLLEESDNISRTIEEGEIVALINPGCCLSCSRFEEARLLWPRKPNHKPKAYEQTHMEAMARRIREQSTDWTDCEDYDA